MTRAEHLRWCKGRALVYVKMGDFENAFNSMASDLNKHPETKSSVELCNTLGLPLLMNGHLDTQEKMTKWIEGFN